MAIRPYQNPDPILHGEQYEKGTHAIRFEPERDFTRYMEQNSKAREWDDLMRTFQQKVPEAKDSEWWATMELVFDMQRHI